MRRLLPIILCAGCLIDNGIRPDPDGADPSGEEGDVALSCSPAAVDFGELRVVDAEQASQVVTCTNTGTIDLHLHDVSLEQSTGVFSATAPSTVLLPPEASMQLAITYAPTADATDVNALIIDSDTPDVVAIPIVGDGIAPQITVSPEEHDFGVLDVGCERTQDITIANTGRDALVVDAMTLKTGSLDLSLSVEGLPWTLAPGTSATAEVTYAPLDVFEVASYLLIDSNDPASATTLAIQTGEGDIYGENTDIFEQPLQAATDILFAVDKSGSMSDDLENVRANFAAYTATLDSLDADYRIAIIVQDSGEVYGGTPFISPDNADDAVDIAEAMLAGAVGGNTERAFTLLEAGLSQAYWLRDDATLHLVGISDEPEQSVGSYADYITAFQALKDDPDLVTLHAIGGPLPSGCATADPYTGFYEATVATDGLFLSLCTSDWGGHLTALAEATTANLSSFPLTEWPVPDTIEVRVDGVQAHTGWQYSGSDNAVHFDGDDVPDGGAIIEIHYVLSSDCDG